MDDFVKIFNEHQANYFIPSVPRQWNNRFRGTWHLCFDIIVVWSSGHTSTLLPSGSCNILMSELGTISGQGDPEPFCKAQHERTDPKDSFMHLPNSKWIGGDACASLLFMYNNQRRWKFRAPSTGRPSLVAEPWRLSFIGKNIDTSLCYHTRTEVLPWFCHVFLQLTRHTSILLAGCCLLEYSKLSSMQSCRSFCTEKTSLTYNKNNWVVMPIWWAEKQ